MTRYVGFPIMGPRILERQFQSIHSPRPGNKLVCSLPTQWLWRSSRVGSWSSWIMQLLCSWCDIVCIDSFKSKLTLWPHTQWCKQRGCVPRAMVAPVTQLTECACAHLDLQGSIVLVRKCDTSWLKYKCILCRVCCSVGGLTLRMIVVFWTDVMPWLWQ